MIVAIRGIGGGVGTTVALGASLLGSKEYQTKTGGSILAHANWRKVSLPAMQDIKFYGWDWGHGTLGERAKLVGVLTDSELSQVPTIVRDFRPRPAPRRPHDAFYSFLPSEQAIAMTASQAVEYYVEELTQLRQTEEEVVGFNLASTESINWDCQKIQNRSDLLGAIKANCDSLSGGMVFAYACILTGIPFCDFTPDLTLECPAIQSLAKKNKVPLAGKDGNTGQSFLKAVVGEMFVRRNIAIRGWYSANVLGNTDGQVLTVPGHSDTKKRDKLNVLESIIPYEFGHVVDISYEKSRGDFKEAWDSLNMEGWLGRRLTFRMDWCAPDSVLAAPLVIDVSRLLWLSRRRGLGGIQRQLSPFFKSPIGVKRTSIISEINAMESFYGATPFWA